MRRIFRAAYLAIFAIVCGVTEVAAADKGSPPYFDATLNLNPGFVDLFRFPEPKGGNYEWAEALLTAEDDPDSSSKGDRILVRWAEPESLAGKTLKVVAYLGGEAKPALEERPALATLVFSKQKITITTSERKRDVPYYDSARGIPCFQAEKTFIKKSYGNGCYAIVWSKSHERPMIAKVVSKFKEGSATPVAYLVAFAFALQPDLQFRVDPEAENQVAMLDPSKRWFVDIATARPKEIDPAMINDGYVRLQRLIYATDPAVTFHVLPDGGFITDRAVDADMGVQMLQQSDIDPDQIACFEAAPLMRCIFAVKWRKYSGRAQEPYDSRAGKLDGVEYRLAQRDIVFEQRPDGQLDARCIYREDGACSEVQASR
ncbi:hypothetical protein [Martelella sp. HB161492]|uniref:hypothetical protein n=1 Tax=Martelella sp. HB161492 TaxID=2720726 RepID=UPI00158FBC3C|nr:hypothetical protein [Martelella sp. HB161492]